MVLVIQTSLQLGSKLLRGFGVMSDDVTFVSQVIRDSMELQAQDELNRNEDRDLDIMKPMQVIILVSVPNLPCYLLHLCIITT